MASLITSRTDTDWLIDWSTSWLGELPGDSWYSRDTALLLGSCWWVRLLEVKKESCFVLLRREAFFLFSICLRCWTQTRWALQLVLVGNWLSIIVFKLTLFSLECLMSSGSPKSHRERLVHSVVHVMKFSIDLKKFKSVSKSNLECYLKS